MSGAFGSLIARQFCVGTHWNHSFAFRFANPARRSSSPETVMRLNSVSVGEIESVRVGTDGPPNSGESLTFTSLGSMMPLLFASLYDCICGHQRPKSG